MNKLLFFTVIKSVPDNIYFSYRQTVRITKDPDRFPKFVTTHPSDDFFSSKCTLFMSLQNMSNVIVS